MNSEQKMDERLWEYIDGLSSPEEQKAIRRLIDSEPTWESKYNELSALHALINNQDLEMPSMRFTKNVMDQITRFQVAPATRNYINKNIIRGIAGFFGILMLGMLIYFFRQLHWTDSPSNSLVPQYSLDANKLNWGKLLNNAYVNVFMLVNVVLGFILLDKYIQRKRKNPLGAKPVS